MSRQERRALARKQNKQAIKAASVQIATNASTGPRTPEGKAVSSQNALSHGLTASTLVLPWENQADFDHLLSELVAEHQPAAITEQILVREMAENYWRLLRARNQEHRLLSQSPLMLDGEDPDLELTFEKRLRLAERYVTRFERAFHKCLSLLRTLQKERRLREAEAKEAAEQQAEREAQEVTGQLRQFVSQNTTNPINTASITRVDEFVSQNATVTSNKTEAAVNI